MAEGLLVFMAIENRMESRLLWLAPIIVTLVFSSQGVQHCPAESCQHFKFVIDEDVAHSHALEGHVFKRSTVHRATQCHMMCRDDCRCVSMNYIHSIQQDNCELNDVNKKMEPAALKYKPGTQYYDLMRDYTTKGGGRFIQGQDHCVNRCCQPNPCLQGGTCEEICDPATVRFTCTCPANYTGPRCDKIKHPRSCCDLFQSGIKISGSYSVSDQQNKSFQVYCDFDSEVGFVWTLIQSFSLENNDHFKTKRFGVDYAVNEDDELINWEAYRLSLPHMQSAADASSHLRATCNFPDDGLVYTDYARAKLLGHDLFGIWLKQCRTYEYINIRGIECQECTAATWQSSDSLWHMSSYSGKSSAGCDFDASAGAVVYEFNFGKYVRANPQFRCTSNSHSTTQHWVGSKTNLRTLTL